MKTPTKIQNFMNTYSVMGQQNNHSSLMQATNKDLQQQLDYSGFNNADSGTIPGMKVCRGPFNMDCTTSRDP